MIPLSLLDGVRRHRRLWAGLIVTLLAIVLTMTGGFLWFLLRVDRPGQLPSHADGIVAFTGGAERVETALRLLAEGRADKLLLSGIGGGAELAELARLAGVEPAPLASRVMLGRSAATTRGNALETAAWAQARGVHSLVVVTAFYHMPRALTELGRVLPDVVLYPLPVQPSGRSGVPLRLMAEEFSKLLAAWAGLTAMLPSHEVAAPRSGHTG